MSTLKTRLGEAKATETPFQPTSTIPKSDVWAAIKYVYDTIVGGVASFSGSFTFNSSELGFWSNIGSGVNLVKIRDRLFVGDACDSTAVRDTHLSWIGSTPQPNLGWLERSGQIVSLSSAGKVGVVGASKSADDETAYGVAIGVVGFAYNNSTTGKSAWGAYFEGKKADGATTSQTYGIEVNGANLNNSYVEYHPYGLVGTGPVVGGVFAAGGDTNVNPTTYDCSAAISITNNGAAWGRGIVFRNSALRNSGTTYASRIAVSMPVEAGFEWLDGDAGRVAWIGATYGTGDKSNSLLFGTNAAYFVNAADNSFSLRINRVASSVNYLTIIPSATGSALSVTAANSGDTNVGINYTAKGTGSHTFLTGGGTQFLVADTASAVNRVQVTGSATGGNCVISTQGSDTNINLDLTPKGTGVVRATKPVRLPSYTVGNLPTGAAGDTALASNGRKNGEGVGAGTGVLVFYDGTNWIACDTGATVAA